MTPDRRASEAAARSTLPRGTGFGEGVTCDGRQIYLNCPCDWRTLTRRSAVRWTIPAACIR